MNASNVILHTYEYPYECTQQHIDCHKHPITEIVLKLTQIIQLKIFGRCLRKSLTRNVRMMLGGGLIWYRNVHVHIKREVKCRSGGDGAQLLLVYKCVCALYHLPVVTNVEWILNNKQILQFSCAPLSIWCFCLGAHFVSCRFIFILLFYCLSPRIVLLPIRLSCVCRYIVVTVFCSFSFLLWRYFSFFPAFSLLFYGSFVGVFVLACGSVSSIQCDIILFFFELCKLVSQHDTTALRCVEPSNVEVCTLFTRIVWCVYLSVSLCMLNLLCCCCYLVGEIAKEKFGHRRLCSCATIVKRAHRVPSRCICVYVYLIVYKHRHENQQPGIVYTRIYKISINVKTIRKFMLVQFV